MCQYGIMKNSTKDQTRAMLTHRLSDLSIGSFHQIRFAGEKIDMTLTPI
jgi:hypothetical protein